MTNTKRHPAVVDLVGGTPQRATADTTPTVTAPVPPTPPKRPRTKDSRSPRLHYIAALIVVVALLGWLSLRLLSGNDESAPKRIADETNTSETAPTLDITPPAPAAAETDLTACRTDPGDQKSGPGVIAAFEHAYYVTRSGPAVRALTTPDTSLPPAEKIQAGIDTVPTGTTHCVRITPITAGIYSIALTEMRPGQPPAQFPQTITTTNIDGRWFVDVIN
ncbi:hypothetical protein HND25_26870 [Rhodococcus erythropolis]|uniref:hypothetical protein n=1 Tax=Rhodococcus erythropolis TaxID=1833 RepID=UPI0004677E90|nr:hypothetical protein [Rhodococcus erythropolis]MBO8149935.1 hypothetical protein [Rhodococcus erythropolis]MDO1492202.1 hypothetical protein [Rhodococcus erythropolis]GCB59583.1 hypothetical protein rerp_59910 [Rhodococcus erythropolis]